MKLSIFAFLLLSSSLYLTSQFNSIGKLLILGFIFLVLFIPVLLKRKEFIVNKTITFLFYAFTLFSCISALILEDSTLFFGAVSFFLIYVALVIVFPSIINEDRNTFIIKALLLSHIPLFVISLLNERVTTGAYSGIFYNPNAFGTIAATTFSLVFVIFLDNFENRTRRSSFFGRFFANRIVQIAILFLSFTFVVLSSSRTSFLAAVAIIATGLILITIRFVKLKKTKLLVTRSLSFSFLFAVVYIVLSRFFPINLYVQFYIMSKFQRKSEDLLDGRGDVWSQTIRDASLFGHGRGYFEEVGTAAHNTFVSILGQYGWLPLIFFILFLLIALRNAYQYSMNNQDVKYRHLPLLMMITFVVLSMGEIMTLKACMFVAFCGIGISSVPSDTKKLELLGMRKYLRNVSQEHIAKQ